MFEQQREEIITRLGIWGQAMAGGVSGYARIDCMVGLQSGTNDLTTDIPISPEVDETERAVCQLPKRERAVIVEHYTRLDCTAEQHWQALDISKSTYYRLHDSAVEQLIGIIRRLTSAAKTTINNNNVKINQKAKIALNSWE